MSNLSNESIENLQSQLAFQEAELEKMHDALYQQQLRMDKMEGQLNRLVEQLKDMVHQQSTGGSPLGEKPPHY